MSFEALVTTAMAGTARRAPEPDPAEPWAQALPADPERALLLRGGAHAVARLAGRRGDAPATPVAPAAPEALRPCAAGAAAYVLALTKDAATRPVAFEALALMRARGLRLPHHLLPDALATTDPEVRAALVPVLGARGAWLAGLRHDWRWGARAEGAGDHVARRRAWDEGTPGERVDALVAVRRDDPAEGRAWVEASTGDKADLRERFVQALATGLSIDDAPLLERALTDRSAGVRQAAARLLARIPGTALGVRMAERAAAVVTGDPARRLVILPPEALPADWAADGIEAKAPPGLGQRAWWLQQLVALVPVGYWRRVGAPAEVARALGADDDWGLAALAGLGQAALAQDAPAWIEAAHDALVARLNEPRTAKQLFVEALQVCRALMARLPADRLAAMALEDLRPGALSTLAGQPRMADRHLPHLARPWPAAFADGFLAALTTRVATLPDAYQAWADPWIAALAAATLGLDPAAEARIPTLSAPDRPPVQPLVQSLDRLRQLLALRRRLVEEIVP